MKSNCTVTIWSRFLYASPIGIKNKYFDRLVCIPGFFIISKVARPLIASTFSGCIPLDARFCKLAIFCIAGSTFRSTSTMRLCMGCFFASLRSTTVKGVGGPPPMIGSAIGSFNNSSMFMILRWMKRFVRDGLKIDSVKTNTPIGIEWTSMKMTM